MIIEPLEVYIQQTVDEMKAYEPNERLVKTYNNFLEKSVEVYKIDPKNYFIEVHPILSGLEHSMCSYLLRNEK